MTLLVASEQTRCRLLSLPLQGASVIRPSILAVFRLRMPRCYESVLRMCQLGDHWTRTSRLQHQHLSLSLRMTEQITILSTWTNISRLQHQQLGES